MPSNIVASQSTIQIIDFRWTMDSRHIDRKKHTHTHSTLTVQCTQDIDNSIHIGEAIHPAKCWNNFAKCKINVNFVCLLLFVFNCSQRMRTRYQLISVSARVRTHTHSNTINLQIEFTCTFVCNLSTMRNISHSMPTNTSSYCKSEMMW